MNHSHKYAQVAIPLPVADPFSYACGNGHAGEGAVGSRVLVPFRNREIQGYVVGWGDEAPDCRVKPIKEWIDEQPILDARFLELTRWISEYYYSSWGEAIENALPKAIRMGSRGIPEGEPAVSSPRAPSLGVEEMVLNHEQEKALAAIRQALVQEEHRSFLLHGVTGSGKTEVYLRAIKTALEMGKDAICLVPEIALTSQIRDFFAGHFSGTLELIHSRLTDRERLMAWTRIRTGKSRVILGPRSALFAPVRKLGLVIVDEEHEASYKQAETPRYHARDVARKRAEIERAVVIFGSATPSLETMQAAETGRILKLVLTKRVVDRELPSVQVVDLKREIENHRKLSMFSFPLQREVNQALEKKEAVLLLLNRRGFATQVQCLLCGNVIQCRHCQISMTYHQSARILLCHYCNFRTEIPGQCPSCSAKGLKYVGWGTEKIESEIARFFPQARVARLDTDVARRKGMQDKVIDEFREGKVDILVGTQMIAKGFDFPRVTTVGVISADVGLALPDFRSSERTFQLLTQVAGRAGRGDKKGRVIIQTFSPHHHSILFAKEHDYAGFYRNDIEKRRELSLPPFSHLVNVVVQGLQENEVYKVGRDLKKLLEEEARKSYQVIGPAPLPFYRLRGHYRWHVMLKGKEVPAMNRNLREVLGKVKKPSRIKIMVDVDPVSVL